MINLELYRIFYVVAETGNVTKASYKLNISQPAVTKHIKNLEDGLGGPLFIRTKKGVVLTEAGQKMFNYIKQALTLIDDAEKSFTSFSNLETGTIKVGISTTLAKKYLVKYIEKFHKLHPNIVIEISTDPTKLMVKEMKNGTLDFIIAKIPNKPDSELDYIELGTLHNIFVVNKDFEELIGKKIKLSDITKYPILLQKTPSNSRECFDEFAIDNNIKIDSIMDIASANLLVDFAKIGYGIGFTTKEYIDDELKRKELFELDVHPELKTNSYGIIKLRNNILPFCSEKFITTLKKDIYYLFLFNK